VRCLPDRIPLKVETDVTHLELGDAIATKDLKLPEGVEVLLPPERTFATVYTAKKRKDEEEATPAAGAAPAGAAKEEPKAT
jgi:large subunit ribosomal protein L25